MLKALILKTQQQNKALPSPEDPHHPSSFSFFTAQRPERAGCLHSVSISHSPFNKQESLILATPTRVTDQLLVAITREFFSA